MRFMQVSWWEGCTHSLLVEIGLVLIVGRAMPGVMFIIRQQFIQEYFKPPVYCWVCSCPVGCLV